MPARTFGPTTAAGNRSWSPGQPLSARRGALSVGSRRVAALHPLEQRAGPWPERPDDVLVLACALVLAELELQAAIEDPCPERR